MSKVDVELTRIAGDHAKKRFKDDFISIAGALRTKNGKIYTGLNLKYRVRNESTCGEAMAIYSALNDGETEFDTVVGVKYFPETDSYEVIVVIDNGQIVEDGSHQELIKQKGQYYDLWQHQHDGLIGE